MTPHDPPLLVVDDDAAIREFVKLTLNLAGYEVVFAADGDEVPAALAEHAPRMVIMDVSMPRLNGLDALRQLRATGRDVPVIMLTALGADQDKLEAFDAGADDYLVKPFSARELVARVAALLRRSRLAVTGDRARAAPLRAGPFAISPDAQTVQVALREIDLTPIEYALLQTLVSSPGRVFTPSELLTRVWGEPYRDQAEILRTTMHRLRQKLEEDPSQPRYLCTRTGVGYYFSTD